MTSVSESTQPAVVMGRGASRLLPRLVAGSRPLIVASDGTMRRTNADRWLPENASVFSEFRPNPTVDHAARAASQRDACGADLIIGLGGGSAMDVAKAARALSTQEGTSIASRPMSARRTPQLVLIPTTAGTGSEVTQFATLYRNGRKTSLDADGVQADISVVDPMLTDTCDASLTWSCAFDALAHAVESLWSIRSTKHSRLYAHAALSQLVPILTEADEIPTLRDRDALCEASILAGRAINITRTTAAHAFSYPLTTHLGIAHGLACALNLTWLAPLVEDADTDAITDPRGPVAVSQAVTSIRHAMCIRVGIGKKIEELLLCRKIIPRFKVRAEQMPLADVIVGEGMVSARMSGTPIGLGRAQLLECMGGLISRLCRVLRRLGYLFGTSGMIVPLTCSGTGGLEAAVTSVLRPGDRVLSVQLGYFGQRLAQIASHFGVQVDIIAPREWGQGIDQGTIAARLSAATYDAVLLTHGETSTGMLSPLSEWISVIRAVGDPLILVDVVSSLGATRISFDELGIDVAIGVTQKALACPPGIALIAASERAISRAGEPGEIAHYLSLYNAVKHIRQSATPYTPALSVMFALDAALAAIEDEGTPNVWRRHAETAERCRNAVRAQGLQVIPDSSWCSPAVTAVRVPGGNAERVR
jgi:aspartate aminotransferase-like enzyme/alcohol dehydrogenase class IV